MPNHESMDLLGYIDENDIVKFLVNFEVLRNQIPGHGRIELKSALQTLDSRFL